MALFTSTEFELTGKRKADIANWILAICFLIAIIYFIRYHFFDSQDISIILLTPFLILPPLLVILNYYKFYTLSGVLGLASFNICLFFVASSESLSTGVSLHFISASAVAIAIYDYSDRWKSMIFIIFSLCLFLITHLTNIQFVEYREYSVNNQQIFLFIHTIGMGLISCLSIFSLLGHNYKLQKYLENNQKLVQQQNDELMKANEELDRFVYSASHDLRAPLSSIKGLISLIENENSQNTADYTPLVKERISVMESFIHDIVHYSRNSRVDVEFEEVEVSPLIKEVVNTLSHFDNAPHLKVEIKLPHDLSIKTDPYRLKVIVTNLISNAIKYADLKKENPSIIVSHKEDIAWFEIIIADNGIGIDQEHLDKVFEMFYRGTLLSKGSGLGLYIAMESARKMNYELGVTSKEREGSTFTLKIPK